MINFSLFLQISPKSWSCKLPFFINSQTKICHKIIQKPSEDVRLQQPINNNFSPPLLNPTCIPIILVQLYIKFADPKSLQIINSQTKICHKIDKVITTCKKHCIRRSITTCLLLSLLNSTGMIPIISDSCPSILEFRRFWSSQGQETNTDTCLQFLIITESFEANKMAMMQPAKQNNLVPKLMYTLHT